jgi:glycosyltransferase involved in cell wall biosynthesis
MVEMERLGWEVSIYPLILQKQTVVHPQANAYLSRAKDIRLLSIQLVRANISALVHHPRLYLLTAARMLWENRTSLKFLLRSLVVFPKSIYMAELMQQEGIQHIHAHYATHPALAAWIIQRFTAIPYSVTVHAHDIYVEKAMLPTKLKNAAFISSISEFNRDYLIGEIGEGIKEKIKVVRCGVLPDQYIQDHHPRSETRFTILNIGSLQPYKGQKYLIEACRLLRERGIPIVCKIVGGGELIHSLKDQIAASDLQETIQLLGPRTQEEIARLLPKADCYVQPSIITSTGKMEGIPVGIMEAMASGVPVVATNISGIPELVRDQQTGLLVPPEDSLALADAIERLYREPKFTQRLIENGIQLVTQEYDLRMNVKTLSLLVEQSMR